MTAVFLWYNSIGDSFIQTYYSSQLFQYNQFYTCFYLMLIIFFVTFCASYQLPYLHYWLVHYNNLLFDRVLLCNLAEMLSNWSNQDRTLYNLCDRYENAPSEKNSK